MGHGLGDGDDLFVEEGVLMFQLDLFGIHGRDAALLPGGDYDGLLDGLAGDAVHILLGSHVVVHTGRLLVLGQVLLDARLLDRPLLLHHLLLLLLALPVLVHLPDVQVLYLGVDLEGHEESVAEEEFEMLDPSLVKHVVQLSHESIDQVYILLQLVVVYLAAPRDSLARHCLFTLPPGCLGYRQSPFVVVHVGRTLFAGGRGASGISRYGFLAQTVILLAHLDFGLGLDETLLFLDGHLGGLGGAECTLLVGRFGTSGFDARLVHLGELFQHELFLAYSVEILESWLGGRFGNYSGLGRLCQGLADDFVEEIEVPFLLHYNRL